MSRLGRYGKIKAGGKGKISDQRLGPIGPGHFREKSTGVAVLADRHSPSGGGWELGKKRYGAARGRREAGCYARESKTNLENQTVDRNGWSKPELYRMHL